MEMESGARFLAFSIFVIFSVSVLRAGFCLIASVPDRCMYYFNFYMFYVFFSCVGKGRNLCWYGRR